MKEKKTNLYLNHGLHGFTRIKPGTRTVFLRVNPCNPWFKKPNQKIHGVMKEKNRSLTEDTKSKAFLRALRALRG
jgi:hypothetical protein